MNQAFPSGWCEEVTKICGEGVKQTLNRALYSSEDSQQQSETNKFHCDLQTNYPAIRCYLAPRRLRGAISLTFMASPKKCLISKYFRTFSTSLSALWASAHDGFPTSHAAVSPCPAAREQRRGRAGRSRAAGHPSRGGSPGRARGARRRGRSRRWLPGRRSPSAAGERRGPARPCRPREPAEEKAALRPVR